ncbi:MAG: hypothetical protein AAGF14_09615, partial [Pseudomonadota bacterium]
STSGREAAAFGVPTTICHAIGAKMFEDEISLRQYAFAENADEILKTIRDGLGNDGADAAKRRHVIEICDRAVDDVLERVLAGADQT